jgi:hypothetical protein
MGKSALFSDKGYEIGTTTHEFGTLKCTHKQKKKYHKNMSQFLMNNGNIKSV